MNFSDIHQQHFSSMLPRLFCRLTGRILKFGDLTLDVGRKERPETNTPHKLLHPRLIRGHSRGHSAPRTALALVTLAIPVDRPTLNVWKTCGACRIPVPLNEVLYVRQLWFFGSLRHADQRLRAKNSGDRTHFSRAPYLVMAHGYSQQQQLLRCTYIVT